ncbi:MAG TPA: NUDIX domain-containing protein [Bacillota bacterium]|jgi:8-oxo-dGTP diphosphatase|nr:NUDIX domain-containing protein [Bacillota bacterium]HOL08876.1 NUDIX domain-containing protein [Bacillota bacterium]HPO96569.1 NUDIX domain-containing protein [Bacillota bacterium]
MKQTTVTIIIDQQFQSQRVLLGLKKTGFGAGKYCGFGGKIEAGETAEAAAIRELNEEAFIVVTKEALKRAGELTYFFPDNPELNLKITIFVASKWAGEPQESTEMKPEWFDAVNIPYNQMWADSIHWLPHILKGHSLTATFIYNSDNTTLQSHEIQIIKKKTAT